MDLIVFIVGLIFGSFANVCIYRLPKGKSIIFPSSFCPNCNKKIKWYDNIPLLSYLILKGKCRYCKKPISPRYFVVEFITGLLFLFIYRKFGLSPSFFIYTLLVLSLVIIGFIDIDTFLIPDVIVLPGIFLGLVVSWLFPKIHDMPKIGSFLYSFCGVILGGATLIFLGFLGKLIFKKEAMGGGDVKMLAMIGSFLGWKAIFLTLFFASLFGTLISLMLILLKKKEMGEYVPFGPYLAIGAIISIFIKGNYFLGIIIN
jgi:leader peptidase (prepilin peptidase)/N-methyltransferase